MANVITPSLVDSFIPNVVAAKALAQLEERRGISRFINTDYSDDIRNYGESVTVPFFGDLGDADTKVPGQQYALTDASDTDVTITLDRFKYKKVLVDDVARAKSRPDVMQGYVNRAIFTVLREVDRDIMNLGLVLTNSIESTSNHYGDIVRGKTSLYERNAPIDGTYIYAISPTKYEDLLTDEQISKQLNFGGAVAMTGSLPQVSGVGLFPTQLVAGDEEFRYNLLMHKDAFAIAVRPLPLDGDGMGVKQGVYNDPASNLSLRLTLGYDASFGGTFVNAEILYGVKILRDELAVAILEDVPVVES